MLEIKGGIQMWKILIIEDEPDIAEIISLHIEAVDRRILHAFDGEVGIKIFHDQKPDLIIVDIMLPKKNGLSIVREVRQTSNIPIIILSSKNQQEDKILGLNLGADDYLEKPFSGLELAARVNAQLRRFHQLGSEVLFTQIVLRELTLDTERMKLFKDGVEIPLTSVEYKILKILMQKPGRVFTKSQIYSEIMGDYFESDESTVMVHISNLRSKIEYNPRQPEYLKTIRGLGYKVE